MEKDLLEIDVNGSTSKQSLIKHFLEPFILVVGIKFNILLIIITYKNNRTKNLRSTKPMRYLLISILISDTWFLLKELNVWFFLFRNGPDLTSFNILCQLSSYLNYFLSILLEVYMISADFILLSIVFRHNNSSSRLNNFAANKNNRSDSLDLKFLRKFSRRNINLINENIELESINTLRLARTRKNQLNRRSISLENDLSKCTQITSSHSSGQIIENSKINLVKPRKSHFVNLIENLRFKREDVYFGIVMKEKVIIILNVFVWMYMLSFLLWIKGVKSINPKATPTFGLSLNFFEMKKDFLLNHTSFSDSLSSQSSINICYTHPFARQLINAFQLFLTLLKNFSLFMNIFSSIVFHIKFRKDYLQSIKSTFSNNVQVAKSKTIKLNRLYFVYSTKTGLNYEKKPSDSNEKLSKKDIEDKKYLLHYDHLHFVRHYAIVAFFYSLLIASSVMNENLTRFNEVKEEYFTNKQNLNKFDSISTLKQESSFLNLPVLFEQNNDYLKSTNSIEDFLFLFKTTATTTKVKLFNSSTRSGEFFLKSNLVQQVNLNNASTSTKSSSSILAMLESLDNGQTNRSNENFRMFLNLTEYLAHSIKFLVYVLFSVHFKFHFRYLDKNASIEKFSQDVSNV